MEESLGAVSDVQNDNHRGSHRHPGDYTPFFNNIHFWISQEMAQRTDYP
jgi:hypothetical protein